MKRSLLMPALFCCMHAFAQEEPSKPALTVSGYLEAYYSYDFNRPLNNTRPSFIYSHNRVNEINLNLGFLKAAYNTDRVRANLAIGAGTYMNANYAAEPGVLKNLYEANAGVKLSKKANLWLDAGVMSSHIGWESAVGKDCWTLSRSLAAENSPYFETGAKLSYVSPSGKWTLAALVLNGWQRIQRVDGNSTPGFGTQATYKPSDKITLNSSSFIGNDKPDSVRQMRYFHDLYGSFQLSSKFSVLAGFDIGAEQKEKGSSDYNIWYTPVLILKYAASPKCAIAARAEYFDDEQGVMVSYGTPNGFKTWGFSANFDYTIVDNVLWRFEVRDLNSKDELFIKRDAGNSSNNLVLSTALAISF